MKMVSKLLFFTAVAASLNATNSAFAWRHDSDPSYAYEPSDDSYTGYSEYSYDSYPYSYGYERHRFDHDRGRFAFGGHDRRR